MSTDKEDREIALSDKAAMDSLFEDESCEAPLFVIKTEGWGQGWRAQNSIPFEVELKKARERFPVLPVGAKIEFVQPPNLVEAMAGVERALLDLSLASQRAASVMAQYAAEAKPAEQAGEKPGGTD